MEKTLKDVLKIIQAIRFQGDSVERLDVAADILIDRLDHPIELEKTIAEKESAVLEYCQEVCPTNGQIKRFQGWHLKNHGEYWSAHHTSGECIFTTKKPSGGESGIFYKYHLAYAVCGLDKRDALEAERAFWTASTDSLTKSLEAEKVKNANGGEFKDMLQQVLNHSNRPEMDDAQFRMFARENINHLLYGNKEGKKDE